MSLKVSSSHYTNQYPCLEICPDEIVLKILQFLNAFQLCVLGRVSWKFNSLSNDVQLWKNLINKDFSYLKQIDEPASRKIYQMLHTSRKNIPRTSGPLAYGKCICFRSLGMENPY
jgi:hypothetical protein